jgi:flavin reductase (DIM6/NTAB) family NADH-FMN oxidoreductase RutF
MDAAPEDLTWTVVYKLMAGTILPRPIGWISTVDEQGRPNLAPFSFFAPVCSDPPHLLFCPGIRETDVQEKDTLRNVRQTGEFVVNIVTEPLAHAMNVSATEFPPEVNEFEVARLTPAPSVAVRAPRVAESPVHFECRVVQIIDLGSDPGAGSVVLGRIVHLHVSDDLLTEGNRIDLARLRPIGRLTGSGYCRVTDLFSIPRPPSQVRPRRPTVADTGTGADA